MDYNPQPQASSSQAGKDGSYTVLRIKRKATDAPLSSLVIQHLEPRLTAKRRRDVSGRSRGVFRLAETVPQSWQGKGEEGEVLKSRIHNLLSTSQPESPQIDPKSPLSPRPAPPEPAPAAVSSPPPSAPVNPTTSIVPSNPVSPTNVEAGPSVQSPSTAPAGSSQTRYRVVPPLSPRTRSMLPPRLLTTAETEGAASPLVFVDAQAVSPTSARSRKSVNPQDEKDMAAFLPMLEEYLRLEETKKKPDPPPVEVEDEWVYDLYYRDNSGSAPLGLGVGDGVTIGELLGFEDISPPSSISGSEPEDEADEDSNDEDYYRNDYPEDEDADEDMEGFRAAGQGDDWSDEDDSEDERGEWGYR